MQVWELVRELTEFPPNMEVVANVTGEYVKAETANCDRVTVFFEDIKGKDITTIERHGVCYLDVDV